MGACFALLLVALASPPEPGPGSLVIVGGGGLPTAVRDEFFQLAGGKAKAKIVVIPTASTEADTAEASTRPWADLNPVSVVVLHTRDPKQANDPAFVKPLTEATAVWFGGGDQVKLIAAYRGTLVEKELRSVLTRGGVIGGTSAGAAVMSDLMIENGNPTAKTGPGFGYLPGIVVDQHFTQRKRQDRLRGTIAAHPGYAGLGIDEATAVIIRGRAIKVVGDGTVTVCWAKTSVKAAREEVVKSGGELDLQQVRRAAEFRAMKDPFPPDPSADPIVPKGSLLIVGGGGAGPEIWKKFIDLAGGPDAPIVFFPTAQDDPIASKHVEVEILKQHGAKNIIVLHTRSRKEADDPAFSKALTTATGVWWGGGRQWRFVDSYEGTLTEKRVKEVLGRGGVIGGSSAGASIQSEYMPRGHPLGNTVMAAEGYERGFGYLPGCAVDQHFFARKRTADMTGLMKQYPQLLGIGIDEGTAIVVTGSTAEVIGKTKVGFYDYRNGPPKGEKDYVEVATGGAYDLKSRKPK